MHSSLSPPHSKQNVHKQTVITKFNTIGYRYPWAQTLNLLKLLPWTEVTQGVINISPPPTNSLPPLNIPFSHSRMATMLSLTTALIIIHILLQIR